jgi:hypothetical protein
MSGKTVILRCEAGNHEWERPSKRGRIPANCPDHTPKPSAKQEKAVSKMQEGRARKAEEHRRGLIAGIITHPKSQNCHCPITPDSTDKELLDMKSCADPYFVCATLDTVRRAVGL